MRVFKYLTIIVTVLLLFAVAAAGQTTGSIKGKVRNQQGKGIEGVTVTVRQDGKDLQTAQTEDGGDFRIGGIKPGFYNLVFEKPGFSGGVLYEVEVRAKKTNKLKESLVLTVDQGTLVIIEASVFNENGFVLPGAKVKVEELLSDGKVREVAEGYSSLDGDVLFRFAEKEATYRITATLRGVSASKEIPVLSAAIYRTAITLNLSEKKDN